MTRLVTGGGSFAPIRPDETDYFAFDFSGEIGVSAMFVGSISEDTLTIPTITNGTVQVGHLIQSPLIAPGTRISDFVTGQGGTGTYKVDQSQNVPSSQMTASADISSVIWDNTVITGVDSSPDVRLLSDPTISRGTTSILVGTMLDGVTYLLSANVILSDGRVLLSSASVACVLTLSPEDEVISVAEFRTIYPAFSDTVRFSDATVAYWLGQAQTLAVIDRVRWGQFYNLGLGLWTAHVLTLGNAQNAAMRGGGSGLGAGVPASKSVNGVSISYDTQMGQQIDAGWYGLTMYGNMFLYYLRMAGMGPIQVGTGYWWNPPGTVIDIAPIGGGMPLLGRWRPW